MWVPCILETSALPWSWQPQASKNHPRGVLGRCLHQKSCPCQPLTLPEVAGLSLLGVPGLRRLLQ